MAQHAGEQWNSDGGPVETTADGRCKVGPHPRHSRTFWASVDGVMVLSDRTGVASRFQTRSAAAEAAIRVRDGGKPPKG